jgi:hypothetical protein
MDPLFDKPGNAVRCEPHKFNCEKKHNLSDVCSQHFYSILAINLLAPEFYISILAHPLCKM